MRHTTKPTDIGKRLRKLAAEGQRRAFIDCIIGLSSDLNQERINNLINQPSPTNRTVLFYLFSHWGSGKKTSEQDYLGLFHYLLTRPVFDLTASWHTPSTQEASLDKSAFDLLQGLIKNEKINDTTLTRIKKYYPDICLQLQAGIKARAAAKGHNETPKELQHPAYDEVYVLVQKLEKRMPMQDKLAELAQEFGVFAVITDPTTGTTSMLTSPLRNKSRVQVFEMAIDELSQRISQLRLPPTQIKLLSGLLGKIKALLPTHYLNNTASLSFEQHEFDEKLGIFIHHLYKYIKQFATHIVYLNIIKKLKSFITLEASFSPEIKHTILTLIDKYLIRKKHILSDKPIDNIEPTHLGSFDAYWQKLLLKLNHVTSDTLTRCFTQLMTGFSDQVLEETTRLIAQCGQVVTPLAAPFFKEKAQRYIIQLGGLMPGGARHIICHHSDDEVMPRLLANTLQNCTVYYTPAQGDPDARPDNLLLAEEHTEQHKNIHALFHFDTSANTIESSPKTTLSVTKKAELLRIISHMSVDDQIIISCSKYNIFISVCKELLTVHDLSFSDQAGINNPIYDKSVTSEPGNRLFEELNRDRNPSSKNESAKTKRMRKSVEYCSHRGANLLTVVAFKT